VEVKLHAFFITGLDEGEGSTSLVVDLPLEERANIYTMYRRLMKVKFGYGCNGEEKITYPIGNRIIPSK
jgi:hypothetical protein